MQISGCAPQFSDGAKKTITTQPPKMAAPMPKAPSASKASVNLHRAGGFHRQQRAK